MDGLMQVYQKAGLHKYMCMYGKVAQCIYHWHIIIIFISTQIIRIQVQNDE